MSAARITNNLSVNNHNVTDPNSAAYGYFPTDGYGIWCLGGELYYNTCSGNTATDICADSTAAGDWNMCYKTQGYSDYNAFSGVAGLYGCRFLSIIPSISGKVSVCVAGHDNLELSAKNATISLDGTDHKTMTDDCGNFTFEDIPPGGHLLIISIPGLPPTSKSVTVTAGQTLELYDLPPMAIECLTGLQGDVNADGKIGIEEVIHALQVVSAVRPR